MVQSNFTSPKSPILNDLVLEQVVHRKNASVVNQIFSFQPQHDKKCLLGHKGKNAFVAGKMEDSHKRGNRRANAVKDVECSGNSSDEPWNRQENCGWLDEEKQLASESISKALIYEKFLKDSGGEGV